MNKRIFSAFSLVFAAIALVATSSVQAQTPRLQATQRQVQSVLNRIESNTNVFRREMQTVVDRGSYNNNQEDRIMDMVGDFETATDTLRGRFTARRTISREVDDVLERATRIDRFMSRNRVAGRASTQWASIRTDLNTLARYYGMTWDWNRDFGPIGGIGTPVYTGTDTQLRNLMTQIENKTDVYKRQMERNLDRSTLDNTNAEDNINAYISRFEEATNRLRNNFNGRRSTVDDATEVLTRARFIDQFMARSRFNRNVTNQWSSIRNDLNTLASYYRVSWNWNETGPTFPSTGGGFGSIDRRLTGTFRLNASQSDNVSTVIDRAVRNQASDRRDRITRALERRLASPDMIAIEKNGRTVSMASTNQPQVTFDADGVARSETNARGRTVRTTATANNSGLTINYEGDRMNDFYVTFAPSGRDQLNVTRRIYLENSNDTVTVSSVYDRVADIAQWSTVNSGGPTNGGGTGDINDFYIPNGTRITATLRNTINTRASQVGDRFQMEITSPSRYRGGIIEGRISEAASSGRITGRANIQLDFDTLRYNGRTYRFAGLVDSVTSVNGDSVSVNNEGAVRDGNRTTQTVTRAGIGAVLGAIIGAVAGGGSGAAIGAGVGAGVGAGSVLIGGRDSIELGTGSTFEITASAPSGVGAIR